MNPYRAAGRGTAMPRLIGVFGGTFDPIHLGHLRAAEELREGLGLDEVLLLPAARPPHRDAPAATAAQRLAMVERAVAGVPGLRVDARELERDGPSYMVTTLESLRVDHPDAALCLLLGADAFLALAGWHRWERLIELAHIGVAHRPGWALEAAGDGPVARLLRAHRGDAADLRAAPAGRVVPLPITALDIAATAIRRLAGAGKSIRFLVTEPVREYIYSERLYQPHPTKHEADGYRTTEATGD